jgi:predicted kinase
MQPPRRSDFTGVILITGIMASGKSTVAQALAERFVNSVHVRGDVFRRMIVNGRADMQPDLALEATRQLHLRYLQAAEVSRRYFRAGFTVIAQDVILGIDLEVMVAHFDGLPLRVVVLCPSPEVVIRREAGRGKSGYGAWTVADLDDGLRQRTPRIGFWLDTSALSVEQSVDAILEHLHEATP